MSKKVRKKHTYEDRLKYMHMLEEGYSIWHIKTTYGINDGLLTYLWIRYQKEGPSALVKKKNTSLSLKQKLQAILDFEEKHLSLAEVEAKYDICESAFRIWRKRYHEGGIEALSRDGRGRPPKDMGRPRKKKPEEMTELERLQYENERLRAENALLKKVQALVRERENRLYETGHKPSKN